MSPTARICAGVTANRDARSLRSPPRRAPRRGQRPAWGRSRLSGLPPHVNVPERAKEETMGQGVVKSTAEAITAINNMKNTINGGLVENINSFIAYGDSLNADNFAGAKADEFYSEWPDTKTALNTAVTRLNEMSDDVLSVNTNIQTAGGNQV